MKLRNCLEKWCSDQIWNSMRIESKQNHLQQILELTNLHLNLNFFYFFLFNCRFFWAVSAGSRWIQHNENADQIKKTLHLVNKNNNTWWDGENQIGFTDCEGWIWLHIKISVFHILHLSFLWNLSLVSQLQDMAEGDPSCASCCCTT